MTKCVFCGREEHPSRGIHLIRNDGNVDFFCSSKCRKNATKLKRDRKKIKWTAAFREQSANVAARAAKAEKAKAE